MNRATHTWLLLASLSAASGCEYVPRLDGKRLLCTEDTDCPEALGPSRRCVEETCVVNSPPRVLPQHRVTRVMSDPPAEITLAVETEDRDEDELSIVWSSDLTPGDPVLTAEGHEARFVPLSTGLHRFLVIADDGYDSSDESAIEVMVVPERPVIFVSATASTAAVDDCGTFERPCTTFDAAIDLVDDNRGELWLAANAAGYSGCLSSPLVVRGCFDPVTWAQDPQRHSECRIVCSPSSTESPVIGHQLGGSTLDGVTVALDSTGLIDQTTVTAEVAGGATAR